MNWRSAREYRIWRAHVIRRDKVCQICGKNKERQAHHINSGSYFPEERYEESNGVCLCKECHIQYHTNFNRSFRVKTDRYNWNNFLTFISYIKRVL